LPQVSPSHVLIVGAGFSGLLTAVHLLSGAGDVRVTLVERRGAFGLGTAYDTGNPDHLLNVRLNNMSAFAEDPGHLSRWLAEQPSWQASSAFITRGTFGRYLQGLLGELQAHAAERLSLVAGEVVDLEQEADGWRADLADGTTIRADAVVLALGNQEPQTPGRLGPGVVESGRYLPDPWAADLAKLSEARSVLLIGTGLTMIDVAVALRASGPQILALSRRGFLPRAHASSEAPAADVVFEGSPSAVLRQVRAAAQDRDWRTVFDALRTQAQRLWADWDDVQRRRFIRHLRPMWDVHRHRLAPTIARHVSHMIASGELTIAAGRIVDVTVVEDGLAVAWRPRGRDAQRVDVFDRVINCTGPAGAVSHSRTPLIRSLLARGYVAPEALGLGFEVEASGALVDAGGRPQQTLFGIGPLCRGAFWEMTAVPDLRGQAKAVADQIRAGLEMRG
jgi:uncharacterized NAD(P)/FAD-binding protein YdhS